MRKISPSPGLDPRTVHPVAIPGAYLWRHTCLISPLDGGKRLGSRSGYFIPWKKKPHFFLKQSRNYSHVVKFWCPLHCLYHPLLVPVFSHINPLHLLQSHTFKIIFLSTPGSSNWFLPLRFPHQNSLCFSLLTSACHVLRLLIFLPDWTALITFNTLCKSESSPLYRFFSTLLHFSTQAQIYFSVPYSLTPSAYVLP